MVTPQSQFCRVDAHCSAWRELTPPDPSVSAAGAAAGQLHRCACISQAVELIEGCGDTPTQVSYRRRNGTDHWAALSAAWRYS